MTYNVFGGTLNPAQSNPVYVDVEQEVAARTMKRVAERTTYSFVRSAEGVCCTDLFNSM